MFWSDVASAHYSKKAIEYYNSNNNRFVPKDQNLPNCPQIRPIEDFWLILKRKVYENGWQAKSAEQLKRIIIASLKKIDKNICHRLMSRIHAKIRIASDLGSSHYFY